MLLPTPSRALAWASLLALTAIPAAAQQTTVHYAWLTPPGTTPAETRVMLMLSCSSTGGEHAHLSLVQPHVKNSRSATHLNSWSRDAKADYYASLDSTQRQSVLETLRLELDSLKSMVHGHVNFIPATIDLVTVPSALLEALPKNVQIEGSCSDLASTIVFAKQRQNEAEQRFVQAGDFQFPETLSDQTSTDADRLATAIVRFFATIYPQNEKKAENCPSPDPALLRPRTAQNVFNTRRERDPVTAPSDGLDRWTLTNKSFVHVELPYSTTISSTGGPGTVNATGSVDVPACGKRSLILLRDGDYVTTDTVTAAVKNDTLRIAVSAVGQSRRKRYLTMDTTRAEVLAMRLSADWGLPELPTWLKHPPADLAAILGFAAGLALAAWYFRRRERARWQRDPVRYLTPEAIHHPVELALSLQLLLQHHAPRREILTLRNEIPDLRKITKYRLPPSDWRRNLWETLESAGELDRLYTRATGKDRHTPTRGWVGLRRATATEKLHAISPQEEVKLLFELKDDSKARGQLDHTLIAEIDRFPGEEVPPKWLPRALADAINAAVDRSRVTRDALARDLPQYFASAEGGAELQPDALGELNRKVDRVIELLANQGSAYEVSGQAGQEENAEAESRAHESGETRQREGHAKSEGRDQLRRRVETLQKEGDHLRDDLAASQSEASQLRSGVTNLEGEVRRLKDALEGVSKENEQLAGSLKEAEGKADEWRVALREVASTPDEASAWLRQSQETTRLVETHGSLLRTVVQRIRALVRRAPHTMDAADDATAPGPETTLVLQDLGLITERLEAVYRSTAARLYRKHPDELAPDPEVPLLDQLAGLERLGAELDRLRAASPRAESVPLLVLAIKNAGKALETMASQRSPLDETDLAPGEMAAGLREMAAAAEARWYQSLLAAAASPETGAAPQDPSLDFLAWLLGNRYVQQLTLMLRLREVINVYFRDTRNREAELLYEVGQQYVRECGVVVQCLRSLGVYLDPVSFLQPPPVAAKQFETNGGRPLLLNTATLHDIVVAKVRSAPVELARTVADVSDWGYECRDLPQLSKPTRGWLCSGLGAL